MKVDVAGRDNGVGDPINTYSFFEVENAGRSPARNGFSAFWEGTRR